MSRLRDLQVEWNALVPAAQERGLRGVREVRLYPQGLHERIPHRQARLDWLRQQLGLTTSLATPVVVEGLSGFTFGVELEFFHPRQSRAAVAAAIRAAGIDINEEGYNHRTGPAWKITTDGSLGNYSTGSEVVSPVLSGDDGFTQLTTVCRVLTSLGCKVTKKCGMHVHIGAAGETTGFFKTLARLYKKAEPVIDGFLAPSRRGAFAGNGFCNTMRINEAALDAATDLDQVVLACGQQVGAHNVRGAGRYRKLNFQSMYQHKTVEFRQHQGTVEAEKACNWVRFCMRLCLAARKGVALTEVTTEATLALLETTETESRYFNGRKSFFDRAAANTARRAAAAY